MVIEYEAQSQVNEGEDILIMGEFNQWFPESMQVREGKRYFYSLKVPAGFKYRYQFIVNGEIVIDPNQDNSESKLGRLTNFKTAVPG